MSSTASFSPEINRSFFIGAFLISFLVGGGILLSGDIGAYLSVSSVFIVVGGTIGATIIQYSADDLITSCKALRGVWFASNHDPIGRIHFLVRAAQAVKKEGPLVLEEIARSTNDPFLRKGLEVTVDAQPAPVIRRILETELRTAHEVASRGTLIFQTMASYAPALGLIGTLLGLVQMMRSLQDAGAIGPAMAVALLTTLYGAILSNLIFLPLAGKIKNRAEEEVFIKSLTIEGIVSIREGENPLVLEQRLESYLPGVKQLV